MAMLRRTAEQPPSAIAHHAAASGSTIVAARDFDGSHAAVWSLTDERVIDAPGEKDAR